MFETLVLDFPAMKSVWPAAACLLWLLPPAAFAREARPSGLDAPRKARADRLVSLFENDTFEIQYGYVEALGDGRGYTVGRGFTTGTGDALEVVRRYSRLKRDNPLARFVPVLEREDGGLSGLEGFPAAWKKCAKDPAFRAIEDAVNDRDSYWPAMRIADRLGLKTPLGRVILYDSAVLHGVGDDADGLPALVARTPKAPSEAEWLARFLEVRQRDIMNARDRKTRAVWRATAERRCPVLRDLLDAGKLDFGPGLEIGRGYDRVLD